MISTLLVAIGAFLIGLVIGHTWGDRAGYKAGFVAGNRLSPESQVFDDFLTHTDSAKIHRIECSREFRISPDMTPEDVALARRFEYHLLCEDVAKTLMNQEIIRPVIVDGDISPYRDSRRVVVSFYIAPDPAFERYSTPRPFCESIDTH